MMLSEEATENENQEIQAGDQIARVYLGEKGGSIQYKKARSRIDWMAGKMQGETALDVGCSQGILALLLGRGPTHIIGIDINAASVEYAQQQLDLESDEVQSRIEFRHADFNTESIKEKNFDTVFIGEVVEHLREPKPFVAKATNRLKDSGRLVMTTPHGFLPHHDHYHAFGLDEFLDLLPDSISVTEMNVVDGYIRMVGEKHSNGQVTRPSKTDIIHLSTNSLIAQQQFFHELLAKKKSHYERLERKLTAHKQREQGHQKATTTLENELLANNNRAGELKNQIDELASNNQKLKQELVATKENLKQAEKLRIKLGEVRSHNGTLQKEIGTTRESLEQMYTGRAFRAGRIVSEAYRQPWPNAFFVLQRLIRLALDKPEPVKSLADKTHAVIEPKPKKASIYQPYQPLKSVYESTFTVAAILDEFTESCFRYEWNLVMLTKNDWQQQIDDNKPAFLFVESAWRGNKGEWNYLLSNYKDKEVNPLRDVVAYCKRAQIPCVFWNKEDPPNYNVFKYAAKDFDFVFTTDADCIPKYQEFCGHNRIYALPFAAQPVLHNPARRHENPQREVAFGGGWYGEKHTARQQYLPPLLDAAITLGLKLSIFDRFSGLNDTKHQFPERYQAYIRTALPYEKMLSAYRMFPVFLNVNSATESPTMFSRRVFELLACGTAVVSSPSAGMQEMLGELVPVAANADDAKILLEELRDDPDRRRQVTHLGYRKVMNEHTYSVRAQTILETVLPAKTISKSQPKISVVLTTNRPEYLRHCKESYTRQSYSNKELILALNSNSFCLEEVNAMFGDLDNIKIFSIPEDKTLAACLNHVLKYVDGDYWAKFDDDDIYGPDYLADSLLPFKYTDADIVGKATYFARIEGDEALYIRHQGKEHDYAKLVCGGSLVVKMGVMRDVSFDESIKKGADTAFLRAATEAAYKIYSADRFNFIQVRGSQIARHTWKIKHEDYLKSCQTVASRYDDQLVLI